MTSRFAETAEPEAAALRNPRCRRRGGARLGARWISRAPSWMAGARLIQLRAKQPRAPGRCCRSRRSSWSRSRVRTMRPADRQRPRRCRADRRRGRRSRRAGRHRRRRGAARSSARTVWSAFPRTRAEQIEAALREPISYLAVGPVFGTATKDTGYAPIGLDLVRRAAARAGDVPVVGDRRASTCGGAPEVLAAGAAAVAVISDLRRPERSGGPASVPDLV